MDDYVSCNWGEVPSRAIVTSSATDAETRKLYQRFLLAAVREFGTPNPNSNSSYTNNDRSRNRDDYENRPTFDNRQGYDNNYDERNFNSSYFDNRNNNYNRDGSGRNSEQGNSGFYAWDRPVSGYAESSNPSDITPIENFYLFESAPRYGDRHNLLFSVS